MNEHGLYYTNDIGTSNATMYRSPIEEINNELNRLRHENYNLNNNINDLELRLSQSNTKLKEEQDKLKLFIEAAGLLINETKLKETVNKLITIRKNKKEFEKLLDIGINELK